MVCDILWADPELHLISPFSKNYHRRCGVLFGKSATVEFLQNNRLLTLIRAHQCVSDGFEAHCWESAFPKIITIFSAENYCKNKNQGAYVVLKVDSSEQGNESAPVRLHAPPRVRYLKCSERRSGHLALVEKGLLDWSERKGANPG